ASGSAATALVSGLSVPSDWTATPGAVDLARLGDGETDQHVYRVVVAADADPGDTADLVAATRFTLGGNRLVVAAGASVELGSPITVGATTAAPEPVRPGDSLTLTVPVTNTSASALAVRAEATLPAAWNGPARSDQRVIEPGATAELTLTA